MSELFSEGWMQQLQDKWNASTDITTPLADAGFSARIAYGFKGEEKPRGMLVIENGVVNQAGGYDGAVATGALQFATGNYRQMIRKPSLANPFMHHFKLMQEIEG